MTLDEANTTSAGPRPDASSTRDADALRRLIHEACEPVAQFWPMKRFVHHNPIHGLEHLPFDRAVRRAKRLLGGSGYLPNREYRELYRAGRIAIECAVEALRRRGPGPPAVAAVPVGERHLQSDEVWRAQLLFGFEALEPLIMQWTLGAGGGRRRFQADLPEATRRRILERRGGAGGHDAEEAYLKDVWDAASLAVETSPPTESPDAVDPTSPAVALPADRTVGDWVERLAGTPVVEPINAQLIKWVSAFVDEGMAGWAMPARQGGLYATWKALAPKDLSGRLLGIPSFAAKVAAWPDSADAAITLALRRLAVPEERWEEYLSRQLAQLPGWAGLIRWLGENPTYPGQAGHPADAAQYLAIRLFYELELADAICQRTWHIPGSAAAVASYWQDRADEYGRLMAGGDATRDRREQRATCERAWPLFRLAQFLELTPEQLRALTPAAVATLLGWLAAFPEDAHGPIWLEAYEETYRRQLAGLLAGRRAAGLRVSADDARPRAQIVFCIDVRSESFRRHVEAHGPYETYGYAGFFGVAMQHEAFDSDERFPLCPVLLSPQIAVDETVRPGEHLPLQSYASGTRWLRLLDQLFHDLKQHPLSSLMLVDVLGFSFSAGLAGKTLAPAFHESVKQALRGWFRPAVATRVAVDGGTAHGPGLASPEESGGGPGTRGFTTAQQADIVAAGLRTIGLTGGYGRFVVLCGHGSVSDNNPYFGALHCGACGGKHGDANARAYATMANQPDVRGLLQQRGLEIPGDVWFLAAKHVTTSDRVEFYDVNDVPASHRPELVKLASDLERAGAAQALERCRRIPQAESGDSPEGAFRHVRERTADWANVRPEWGLSSNAAFIIGRRSLTHGVNLQGRAFLHSYHPDHDPEGAILERIMTAPLIVGQWINMEHYFSAVDPWFWGSGSKVIHNVVSGVGVMAGSQSDLLTGLPLQTVNNGAVHHHEPMRLLTVIEAPVARISSVIARHALLQGLFHNQWLNLLALDPSTSEFHRYRPDGTWEAVPPDGGVTRSTEAA